MERPAAWPWPPKYAPMRDLTNASATDCEHENHLAYLLYVSVMVTAGTVALLLSLTQQRKDQCTNFLWGIPGIVIPIKFLNSTPFRFIYCVIMSAWGGDVLQNIFDKGLYFRSGNGLLDAFDFFVATPTVIILSQALAYYPVFACVDAPVPLLGHVIGFFYTLLLAASNVFAEVTNIRGCSYQGVLTNRKIGISLAVAGPVYVFYVVIACWFFCHAAMEIMLFLFERHSLRENIPDCDEYCGDFDCVRALLRKPVRLVRRGVIYYDNLMNYLIRGLKFVLPYNSNFRYPLPFLGALLMAYTMLYQMVVSWTAHEVIFSYHFMDFVGSFNETVHMFGTLFPELKPKVDNIYADVKSFAMSTQVILPVGTTIAFWITLLFTMYMVQSFHKQIRRASKGDTSFLVMSEPLPSLAYMLAGTMKYSAFQVAYLLATWMLYSVMMCTLMGVGLGFYYLFKDSVNFGIHLWSWFMIPMMWAAGLHHLELFICRYIFLEEKDGKFVAVRYRHLYQLTTYIFFFFNVIFGFVMCVLRVFGVVIFTMVMLFRIDWDVYMRGLEGWDIANRTYVSYVYMEYTYNNPVLRTFVKLLQDTVKGGRKRGRRRRGSGGSSVVHTGLLNASIQKNLGTTSSDEDEESSQLNIHSHTRRVINGGPVLQRVCNDPPSFKSRQAHNRWLVAYTLLRNPRLQGLTASRIMERGPISYEHFHTTGGPTDYGTTHIHR